MFETEADEKEMPLNQGKGPGAEEPTPTKDAPPSQELPVRQDFPPRKDPSPSQELPLGQDLVPSKDPSTGQEAAPGPESPPSKDTATCQEPPQNSETSKRKDQGSPPTTELPSCQDPLLCQELPVILEPSASVQNFPPSQGSPHSQGSLPEKVLDEQTISSGEQPATTAAVSPASRPNFVIPEVRLDSAYNQQDGAHGGSSGEDEEAEEVEEDEEEDTSDDNYGDLGEAKRSSLIETGQGAEGGLSLRVQNSLRRRTHSEGSLLQETRGPCFSSDTTLHCSDGEGTTSTWAIPSPRTLKKELGRNGGSMHHLSLFFPGHRKVRRGAGGRAGDGDEEGDSSSCGKASRYQEGEAICSDVLFPRSDVQWSQLKTEKVWFGSEHCAFGFKGSR